jgi:hypothetical protein
LLGADTESHFAEECVSLQPGDVLLLFTDGLIEQRGVPIDDALAELTERASRWVPEPAWPQVDRAIADANPADNDGLLLPGGVANPDELPTVPAAVQFTKSLVRRSGLWPVGMGRGQVGRLLGAKTTELGAAMNDRKAGSAAAGRRTKKRSSRRLRGGSAAQSQENARRQRDKQPGGDMQLSEDIAHEHQAQLNQLRDEPVPASHYDDRHAQTEQGDAGQE